MTTEVQGHSVLYGESIFQKKQEEPTTYIFLSFRELPRLQIITGQLYSRIPAKGMHHYFKVTPPPGSELLQQAGWQFSEP